MEAVVVTAEVVVAGADGDDREVSARNGENGADGATWG
jgi:hypothetical protein